MDNWLFLALLAPALYAIVNFLDKYIVEERVQDQSAIPGYLGLAALFFGTTVWLATGRPSLTVFDATIVLATGALSLFALVLYFRALSLDQTSMVILLTQMTPVFILILASVFLGETITLRQSLGFLIILSAALGLSYEKQEGERFRFSQSFFLILLVDILFAISYILIKFALEINSFAGTVAYESWGMFLGGLTFFLFSRDSRIAFFENVRVSPISFFGLILLSESLFVVAKAVTFRALLFGATALVSVLEGTQMFYSILFGWGLTMLYPHIFKEDIGWSGMRKKLFAAGFLFVGIWLVRG